MNEKILAILDLWFGKTEPGKVPPEKIQKMWWTPDRSLDSFLREKYESDLKKAAVGDLEHWKETSRGTLALIILLDQFPRNIYRGTPDAFSFDGMALSVAEEGIKRDMTGSFILLCEYFFICHSCIPRIRNTRRDVWSFSKCSNLNLMPMKR